MHREVAGRGVEQIEELQLGVFESRVGHVVNERDLEARGVEGSDRADRFFLRQAGWNSASIHYDGHVRPLKPMTILMQANFRWLPSQVPERNLQLYRRCGRCPRSAESSLASHPPFVVLQASVGGALWTRDGT